MKDFIINTMYAMLMDALAKKAADTESQVDDRLVAILQDEQAGVVQLLKDTLS